MARDGRHFARAAINCPSRPFFILSGFSFPISSMPDVLQWLTYVNLYHSDCLDVALHFSFSKIARLSSRVGLILSNRRRCGSC